MARAVGSRAPSLARDFAAGRDGVAGAPVLKRISSRTDVVLYVRQALLSADGGDRIAQFLGGGCAGKEPAVSVVAMWLSLMVTCSPT